MSTNKRIPIKLVAELAGVSTQTVSRVTNNRPDVSPETRKHVLKIIQELGYRPSRVARAMRGAGRMIGVVGFGLEYYGPSQTLVGVEQQAKAEGYGLVLELLPDPENFEFELIIDKLLDNHVDGVAWCIPHIGNNMNRLAEYASTSDVPFVCTDTAPSNHVSLVEVDNFYGGKLATTHLIEQGHRCIGLITGPESYHSARERRRGWAAALQEHGLAPDASLIVEGDWTARSGAEGFRKLIARRPDITALFTGNDPMALGAMWAARRHGLGIPDQLAVIGYDDVPEAEYYEPSLSSVHQNVASLGTRAVLLLIRHIEARRRGDTLPPETLWIYPELVIRESSLHRISGQSINLA